MAKAERHYTPTFRVSYPNVFKARKNDQSGKMEYSLVALFPADADLKALRNAATAAIKQKWGDDPQKWPKVPKLRSPFRDQGERKKEEKDAQGNTIEVLPDGYTAGCIYLNLKSEGKPGIVDKDGKTPIESAETFYAGCFARASLTCYAYEALKEGKVVNRGVNFGLQNIQKVAEGDPFSSRRKAEEDFSPIAGTEENGAFDVNDPFAE